MKKKKYEFSNTQVQLPSDLVDRILSEGRKLVNRRNLYSSDQGYEDKPHITVLYGVHADSPPLSLIDILETYPKFTIQLGLVSLFKGVENDNGFDVVKIDINNPDLHVLNQAVEECCEYTDQFDEYNPHITIAYVKPDTCDYLTNNPTFKGLSFVVDRILFSGHSGNKREIFLARR